jgi:hypothetical protein
MPYTVKFWDNPFSTVPMEIDFLTADTYAAAMEMAAARVKELREKYDDRVGYFIEDESGRVMMTGPGRR